MRHSTWLPALGALVAAAAGALVAVGRPGAASLGVGGLLLVPIGALIFGRPARAAALAATLAYAVVLMWAL